MRIGVVAASSRFSAAAAERAQAIATRDFPKAELVFHPHCSAVHNHFAGTDEARAEALVAYANDPAIDAIWFARGGHGVCRIAEGVIERLNGTARDKAWLGYSDAGFLLAGLHRAGFPHLAHGPMVQDGLREGGEAALARALAWLIDRDAAALEPHLAKGDRHAAFNLTVLGMLLGTPLEPDLAGHILMIEEVSEHLYASDRALFHLTASANVRRTAGLRLGRVSDILPNDPDFGESAEAVVRFWCERAGIPYLGAADIGHDSANKIVPFGPF